MLSSLISLYTFVIFVRIILSWFPMNPSGPFGQINRVLFQVTEPVLGPARRIIPSIGPLDISPIAVLIALNILQFLLETVGL